MFNLNDTICALATPPGVGGIAIVRISGPEALKILQKIFVPMGKKAVFTSHLLFYGHLLFEGQKADECMAVYMRAPRSYTKEDVCEIHCHGGTIPARMALKAAMQAGARLAQSGEFTKRAFLNGRLDLSSAEAVMDFISSRTKEAALASLGRMGGALQKRISRMQTILLDTIAALEAYLDYPEDDVEETTAQGAKAQLAQVEAELKDALKNAKAGLLLRDGLHVAIVGKPNVGKSSLLNALLGEERAIVTEEAGTTRDTLTEEMQLDGIPILLTDTAGIRQSENRVEQIGIDRARTQLSQSNVVLWVLDASSPLQEQDHRLYLSVKDKPCLCLLNKSDLKQALSKETLPSLLGEAAFPFKILEISVLSGEGLEKVRENLKEMALQGASPENAYLANERHIESVHLALQALARAQEALSALSLDVADLDIHEAWQNLGEITGETANEAIIDRIFEKFCLGK